jgi:Leucine-rich repeat (LRR) protein
MTGTIRDDAHSEMSSSYGSLSLNSSQPSMPGRLSPQHHLYGTQQQKPNFLGRIRHSLATEEVATSAPSAAPEQTLATLTPPPRYPSKIAYASSSDDDEILSHDELLGGAFPSPDAREMDRKWPASPGVSEIQEDESDARPSLLSEARAILASASAERDSLSQSLPVNLSATSSEEAWDKVVQDQSDVTTSREESLGSTPPSASAFRSFSSDDNPNLSQQSTSGTASRYDMYRANAGRNFFRDEKPWSSITKAATSSIEIEPAKPRAEEQHMDSAPAAYAGKEVALESDKDSSPSSQNTDANNVSVFADSSEGSGIFQDTSNDQSRSDDDDGGFPATATMMALARKKTPPTSPGTPRAIIEVDTESEDGDYSENDDDSDSSGSFAEEYEVEIPDDDNDSSGSSTEEYEVAIPDDDEYEQNYRERAEQEKKERMEAAMGLAAAAQMSQLRSTEDNSLQRRARSLDDLHYQPVSRKSKKFQMWTEQGVYVRSSDSPSVSANSSAASEPPFVVARPRRESIYDKNTSSTWRKSLGALFRWRYPEPRKSLDSPHLESLQADNNEEMIYRSAPPRVYSSEEEEKRERAKMLAAAAIFKKDDLTHVQETEQVQPELNPDDPRVLQRSLAAAAAAMATKRQERSEPFEDPRKRDDQSDDNENNEDVNPGSLAAQAALLARRKNSTTSLRSSEDYDNLYKKEPPKKEEPKLMVQLRSVKQGLQSEEKRPESDDKDVPKLMVQLRPVSDRVDRNLDNPTSDVESGSSEEEEELQRLAAVSSSSKHFPWPKWGGSKNKDLEAYEAFSEPSSYASSLTNIEPVYYKQLPSPRTRVLRHFLRGSVVLLILAAIGLPLYFFVLTDYGDRSTPDGNGIGGIFPPIATPGPSIFPSAQPTVEQVPTAISESPEARPSPSPSKQASTTPTAQPTQEGDSPTPAPSNAPTVAPVSPTETPVPSPSVSPGSDLENLLISFWPPLEDILNDSDAASAPQVRAIEWMRADPNINVYSERQILQRFAMATFFYSTGGENWVENEGWLSEENECLWYTSSFRIPCDESQNLLFLELAANGLSGNLPSELALLSNSLTRLALPGTNGSEEDGTAQLVGSIPSEYGLLSNLEYIDLNSHELSGTLSSQIGQLSLLAVLDLEGNDFNGSIPTTVGMLQSLNNLYLAFNSITGVVPSELGQLSLLVNLDLYGNRLSSTLPTELGNLAILQSMSLGFNRIEGSIPPEIGQLSNLQGSIDLSGNLLIGAIPTELGQLRPIRNLNLSFNRLSGPLPPELGQLENLLSLQLQENQLTSVVPMSFSNLVKLEQLRLEFNSLTGTVPPLVCQNLVWDRIFDATLFLTDCVEEIECSCCQYCCEDAVGCTCQFEGTDNELFCLSPVELEDARVIIIP